MSKSWRLYQGTKPAPAKAVQAWLDDPPPWRRPLAAPVATRPIPDLDEPATRRADHYVVTGGEAELDAVNVALLLRRPLLVRGEPGIGKSTLAYSIAKALGLGLPLRWEIGSRTTLQEGLYDYDAVSHLRDKEQGDLGRYITLGPLGTALLPGARPRVLLIDELDKASYDLPNDLLHVFEEGHFRVRELARRQGPARVYPYDFWDEGDRVELTEGLVRTAHFPVVIITTNGEREFPAAFLRRCVTLDLTRPDADTMAELVRGWFSDSNDAARAVEAASAHAGRPPDEVLQLVFTDLRGLDARPALPKRDAE